MWLNDSNREKHLVYGAAVFIAAFVANLLLTQEVISSFYIAMSAMENVIVAALALELKDMLYGNKFDWLDILATVFIPAVVTIIIILIYFF